MAATAFSSITLALAAVPGLNATDYKYDEGAVATDNVGIDRKVVCDSYPGSRC
jgi:hypothetical protein